MTKVCDRCSEPYKGFGQTCASCRRSGSVISLGLDSTTAPQNGEGNDSEEGPRILRRESSQTDAGNEICSACGKRVYMMEMRRAEGLTFHKSCFKCKTCDRTLDENFGRNEAGFFCVAHFREATKESKAVQAHKCTGLWGSLQRGLPKGSDATATTCNGGRTMDKQGNGELGANGDTLDGDARGVGEVNTETPALVLENGEVMTRDKFYELVKESVRVQLLVQRKVSDCAQTLVKEKKKLKPISFLKAHKHVMALELPEDPLEANGVTDDVLRRLLDVYEKDEEIHQVIHKMQHPDSRGDPERVARITLEDIAAIHRVMVAELRRVLAEFVQLPKDVREPLGPRDVELTAEFLAAVAVEKRFPEFNSGDVEQAMAINEVLTEQHPEICQSVQELQATVQELTYAAKPRMARHKFLEVLEGVGRKTKMTKNSLKDLFDEYRLKACAITDVYSRFESLCDEVEELIATEGETHPVELQMCYEEYGDDEEVQLAWRQANADMFVGSFGGSAGSQGTASVSQKKCKKMKVKSLVEMQELMVDEMKRVTLSVIQACQTEAGKQLLWKADVVVQLVQSISHAAVERRYETTAEDIASACVREAAALQQNSRFVAATGKQQEILVTVRNFCCAESARRETAKQQMLVLDSE